MFSKAYAVGLITTCVSQTRLITAVRLHQVREEEPRPCPPRPCFCPLSPHHALPSSSLCGDLGPTPAACRPTLPLAAGPGQLSWALRVAPDPTGTARSLCPTPSLVPQAVECRQSIQQPTLQVPCWLGPCRLGGVRGSTEAPAPPAFPQLLRWALLPAEGGGGSWGLCLCSSLLFSVSPWQVPAGILIL